MGIFAKPRRNNEKITIPSLLLPHQQKQVYQQRDLANPSWKSHSSCCVLHTLYCWQNTMWTTAKRTAKPTQANLWTLVVCAFVLIYATKRTKLTEFSLTSRTHSTGTQQAPSKANQVTLGRRKIVFLHQLQHQLSSFQNASLSSLSYIFSTCRCLQSCLQHVLCDLPMHTGSGSSSTLHRSNKELTPPAERFSFADDCRSLHSWRLLVLTVPSSLKTTF